MRLKIQQRTSEREGKEHVSASTPEYQNVDKIILKRKRQIKESEKSSSEVDQNVKRQKNKLKSKSAL